VNRPIIRLYGLVVVLFGLLVAFTSRWTIFEASSLRANPLNARALLEQERIARGPILAADGTVLARSRRGSEGAYERTYPMGEEFAHAIGYSFINAGSTGLERFRNAELDGRSGTNLQTILDQLQGKKPQGDKVLTTLDPTAQRIANEALAGQLPHQGETLHQLIATKLTQPVSAAVAKSRVPSSKRLLLICQYSRTSCSPLMTPSRGVVSPGSENVAYRILFFVCVVSFVVGF